MLDTNWLQKVKNFWNLESGGVYKLYGYTCNIEGDDNRSNALKFLGGKSLINPYILWKVLRYKCIKQNEFSP